MKNKNIIRLIIFGIIIAAGLNLWKQKMQKQEIKDNSKIESEYKNHLSVTQTVAKEGPEELDIELLFSSSPIEESMIYEVKPGDSLYSIAKKTGTTVGLIKTSNKLEGSNIRAGQRLKIIEGEFKIVVNVSNNTLTLFLNDKLVKIYPVGTAKYRNTPIGEFEIINRIVNPTWYAPDGVYPYGDPKNILGTRWMGINEPSYGIHGTTEPELIGKYVSAGCIRMYNKDVEELFKIVPVGTKVSIIKKEE